jgi:hypothetical protein
MERIAKTPKKDYQSPTLQIYGNLADMTKSGATSTMSDKGNNHMS